ncbi:hypothetical protein WP8S18E11_19920 [Aeromonas veronii]|nr:hypothetical protein WP8S18E11_19920 [Aeromonas veronii]
MITNPIPPLKPTSTGKEIKLATNPNRNTAASISNIPTSMVRVAVTVSSRSGSPSGTTIPNWVAVRMASVLVELTLSTLEEPSSA